jgi:integrase
MTINSANERVKYRYFDYLREVGQLAEHSIDQVAKALNRFEVFTNFRAFRDFRIEHAKAFKRDLAKQTGQRTGAPLSKATITSTLNALRAFFAWLASEKAYRTKITRNDADYFKPLRSDVAVARARRHSPIPKLDQIRRMLAAMPVETEIERRNQAIVAITIVTGARDNATASLRMKHLDLDDEQLFQDAREVRTKFRKTFPTWLFPVGDDLVAIVADWKRYLETSLDFGADDPLFPLTVVAFGSNGERMPPRLGRACWSNADAIRGIFKEACRVARLPNFTPHSFRHTLAELGSRLCKTPAEYKAWSQNLGHKDTLVTLTSYGTLPGYDQRDLIKGLSKRKKRGK